MADITNETAVQSQVKGCTGDCKLCNVLQRGYCASQITYNNMGLISDVLGAMDELRKEVKALSAKVEAIQNSEAELIDPIGGDEEEISAAGRPLV